MRFINDDRKSIFRKPRRPCPFFRRGGGKKHPLTQVSKQKLAVIGLGSVGKAVKHTFDFFYDTVDGYDIDGRGNWENVLHSDISFICVSTPESEDGHLDCSNVDNVLCRLSASGYSGICVIKSTVSVGFTDASTKKYSNLRIVYMPEFLREKSNFTWFVNPDRLVISGEIADMDKVIELFWWVDDVGESVPILKMKNIEAEIGKLAHNARIAVLVSFTNEIESACMEYEADSDNVMSVIHADRRVNSKEHLKPKLGGYGGKCVPKDTKELIVSMKNPILLTAAEERNRITLERD
ncbi:hypothetical protein MmiEs2_14860 [Methanimicrococcus stummii]|uniref:Uncharacterized protein n=1 Tax=Methanimicrococcus stummii TaxID=3028294 RepID=A0AA96VB97_9EURY|nr:hypothetical protein [Methanimicrococcus sp. Es2]WNY29261.1 hypothetical protein MmiEs2_14860 [Methanimicrococcus sp. Es2]